MALTTLAGVNTALPGQRWRWLKSALLTNGSWLSEWTIAGSPGQGVAPSSGLAGDVPTKATTGAPNFVNPSGANTYLGPITANVLMPSTPAYLTMALYDRLWHNSGINVTITTGQTVSANDAGAVHLTRPDANGAMVEAWYEVYVVMGAGTPTVTLAYTDQDGNAETTGSSGALATTMGVGRTGQFQLATGDTGVRSIQTWTANATFTSGTIGLVLRRLVTSILLRLNDPTTYDAIGVGLPRVYDDACLETLWYPATGNTPSGVIEFSLIQG